MMTTGLKMYLPSSLVTHPCHGKGWTRESLILLVASNNLISLSCLFLMLVCLSDVSGTALSHSFELEATKKTVFYGAPAVITFRIPTKAALQVSHSCLYGSTLYA